MSLTSMSQQLQGMQKMLGSMYQQPGLFRSAGTAHAPGHWSDTCPTPQQALATTPAKKQTARLVKAQNLLASSLKLLLTGMDNPPWVLGSHVLASLATTAVVLAGPSSAVAIAHPGSNGKP